MKTANKLIYFCLFILFFSSPVHHLAEGADILIHDLTFNQETRILSGKSVPHADISLTDLVASVQADAQGYFEVPIPEDMTTSTLIVMDFMQNKSVEVAYDFITGKEKGKPNTPLKTNNQTSQTRTYISEKKHDVSSKQELKSSTIHPLTIETTQQKPTGVFPWAISFIFLIAGATFVLISFYKKEKAKKERRKKRKKHKKRRRKKTSNSRHSH